MKAFIQITMLVSMIAGFSAPAFAAPCNSQSDEKAKSLPAESTGSTDKGAATGQTVVDQKDEIKK